MQAQDTSALVGTLIFNHMALNGHWCTAAAVARDLLGSSVAVAAEDVQDFSARGCVRECIMRGDIDAALVHAQAYMPGSLTSCQPILFRMQCQKLVELVCIPWRKCSGGLYSFAYLLNKADAQAKAV